jgi:NAD(P)-dependent dehydrogenase (short-subunit alcohol dehydrogenase family)
MAKSHHDKIAVVSGGANGIGQAFAQRLAQDGAHIVIADIASGSNTMSMVEQAGRQASPKAS